MRSSRLTWVVAAVAVVLVGGGAYLIFGGHKAAPVTPPALPVYSSAIIGKSVEGREITAYTYGAGTKKLLFVGGIHGGYEWNSVLLAYEFMDYLKANPSAVPVGLSVTVIPSLNPDGVFKVVGVEGRFTIAQVSTSSVTLAAGRFNAHKVDLNRNFDCKWQATATWQSRTVSAGGAAFSEPEAAAFRDYVLKSRPDGVIFWHSQANSVYTSDCGGGILPGTAQIANAYATASGYPKADTFTAYAVTGDSTDWLASVHIPAITVELSTHANVEWDRNLAGIKALLTLYTQKI
jgi:hypothetical protein